MLSKKHEKYTWRKVTFSKVSGFRFFTFHKLYKWYQIAQSISYFKKIMSIKAKKKKKKKKKKGKKERKIVNIILLYFLKSSMPLHCSLVKALPKVIRHESLAIMLFQIIYWCKCNFV